MGNALAKERKVDIIFCIDGSGSMSPCLDKVKANAKKFYMDLVEMITNDYNSSIEELNIKVITFRDYAEDGEQAMVESRWFDITAGDDVEYEKHLNGIIADGGGDEPENGLEALFLAMTSKWNAKGDNDRQIIVLFTDADALPLKARQGQGKYPADMVDEGGLLQAWMGVRPSFLSQGDFNLKERCKRLIMFAPSGTVYSQMQASYNRSQFKPVELDSGLKEISFDDILKIIAASASSV